MKKSFNICGTTYIVLHTESLIIMQYTSTIQPLNLQHSPVELSFFFPKIGLAITEHNNIFILFCQLTTNNIPTGYSKEPGIQYNTVFL